MQQQERPILFTSPMISAIIEGRKTQTRRIIKPQPYHDGTWWRYDGTRPKSKKETGAIAEGIDSFRPVPGDGPPETVYRDYMVDEKAKTGQAVRKYPFTFPILSYRTLWEKINGPNSWYLNPWVWVIQFQKL